MERCLKTFFRPPQLARPGSPRKVIQQDMPRQEGLRETIAARCDKIVRSSTFQTTVMLAILAVGALEVCSVENFGNRVARNVASNLILALFTFEIVVKMLALESPRLYFDDPWVCGRACAQLLHDTTTRYHRTDSTSLLSHSRLLASCSTWVQSPPCACCDCFESFDCCTSSPLFAQSRQRCFLRAITLGKGQLDKFARTILTVGARA